MSKIHYSIIKKFYKKYKIFTTQYAVLFIIALLLIVTPSKVNANFFKGILILYTDKVSKSDLYKIDKYNIIVINRFTKDFNNNYLSKTIRNRNEKKSVYIYQLGPETNVNQDNYKIQYLNSIGRYNLLKSNHSNLFLINSHGNEIRNPSYPNSVLMKFGSSDYQKIWIESTMHDIYYQPWKADGIFIDNCLTATENNNKNPFGGHYPNDHNYENNESWNKSMIRFINTVTMAMHKKGQKILVNRGNTRFHEGYNSWIDLDQSDTTPDILLEEGAFGVHWSDENDIQFFDEEEWKRQVDIVSQIMNSEVALLSHTNLSPNHPKGTDNFGKPVTFWQVLWYSLCSYHLARKDNPNNSYFMFGSKGYKNVWWFDEYHKINLGKALSTYKIQSISGTNVYFREFEKGYILVNPTDTDIKSFNLPKRCIQRTHENLYTHISSLPITSTISIPSHHGVICQIPYTVTK